MGTRGQVDVKEQRRHDVGTGVAAALERVGLSAGMLDRQPEVDGVVCTEDGRTHGNTCEWSRGKIVPATVQCLASVFMAPGRAGPREEEIALPHPRVESL